LNAIEHGSTRSSVKIGADMSWIGMAHCALLWLIGL